MSNFTIFDGKTGRTATVTTESQLSVFSESKTSEGVAAQTGEAYIVHVEALLTATPSGALLTIQNLESEAVLELTRVYIDPHVLTPVDLIMTQQFDATITGGDIVTTTAVVQKNRRLAAQPNVLVKASDGTPMTQANGVEYHSFPVNSMTSTQRDMSQTNILARNNSVTFGFKTDSGANAVAGEKIGLSINFVRRVL